MRRASKLSTSLPAQTSFLTSHLQLFASEVFMCFCCCCCILPHKSQLSFMTCRIWILHLKILQSLQELIYFIKHELTPRLQVLWVWSPGHCPVPLWVTSFFPGVFYCSPQTNFFHPTCCFTSPSKACQTRPDWAAKTRQFVVFSVVPSWKWPRR